MNTKIMLTLCAMIAGCTSVSAVESSIDSKEMSEQNTNQQVNRFVLGVKSKIEEISALITKDPMFDFKNVDEISNKSEEIVSFASALDKLMNIVTEATENSTRIHRSNSDWSHKSEIFQLDKQLEELENLLCRALYKMAQEDFKENSMAMLRFRYMPNHFRDGPHASTFKKLARDRIFAAQRSEMNGRAEDASEIVGLVKESLNKTARNVRFISNNMQYSGLYNYEK